MANEHFPKEQNIKIAYSEIVTLVDVEYPGKIVDYQKALETLGGLKSLTKVHNADEARLRLQFRPGDIYCKSAYGTGYPVSSVLLKVKQKRHKTTGATKLFAELVGVIATAYKFDTMMDYQYLTMERVGDEYRSLRGISTLESLESTSWLDNGAPLHFIPQIFSPLDIPYSYHFKEEDNKRSEEEEKLGFMFVTARKRRSNFNQAIPYEDDAPTEPTPEAEAKIKTTYLRRKLDEVSKLFETRPIWTRAALSAVSKLNMNRLRILLPCLAYNAVSGPWRTMWIRYGYDPKHHVEAKHLQLIDYRYRAKDKVEMAKSIVLHKRSCSNYFSSVSKSKRKLAISDQLEHFNRADADLEEEDMTEEEQKTHYMFWPGLIPPYRQLFYQIIDLQVPEVQDLVNSNNFKEPACSKIHGFLEPDACDRIRAIINEYVLKAVNEKMGGAGEMTDQEKDSDVSMSDGDMDESVLETYR
ncbi:general transcription factor 3C polypeptide 5-like [Watersipora subatra]|uniref:general transcription factor 3C polypeptide 5-like n=1 Tax=Watersipora subatra TaxID=2589382 RepID=UPI00355B6DF9